MDVPECSTVCQGSGALGNTSLAPSPSVCETINPAIRWCFTLNNWTEEEWCAIKTVCARECRYAVVGKEIGEMGTPHLQGYIEFKKKKRPLHTFGINRIHWAKCLGNKIQNQIYCKKDKNYWEFDIMDTEMDWPEKWYDWQNEIIDMIDTKPDNRTIHWYWSENGGIGKTILQKWLCLKGIRVLCTGGKGADVRHSVASYLKDNKVLPRTVLFNIPRTVSSDYVSYEALENVKDMMFYSGKYEGGMCVGPCPHVLVFANAPPIEEKMSIDRWRIIKLD